MDFLWEDSFSTLWVERIRTLIKDAIDKIIEGKDNKTEDTIIKEKVKVKDKVRDKDNKDRENR